MKEILKSAEAWADFWQYIKGAPEWAGLTRKERQYLDKTNREVGVGKVGHRRLENIFAKYAPGRYVYAEGFVKNDTTK